MKQRAGNRPPAESGPWPFALACVGAAGLLLAAYSNHFHNSFHFDDTHVIVDNLWIRSLSNVPRFFSDVTTFSSFTPNVTYRPLLLATFAFDYWAGGGLDPLAFHVTQFVLLVLLGAMLVALFRRVFDHAGAHPSNRWAALCGAALFCLHTANTETVNYISSRSDLLSTLFVVAGLLAYTHLPRLGKLHPWIVVMAAGALVKVPAVMLAPLLLVYLLLFVEELSFADVFTPRAFSRVRSAVLWSLPAFVAAALLYLLVARMNPPGQNYGGTDRIGYLRTQAYVCMHYLRLFFVPTGLTADSDLTIVESWLDARVLAGLAVVAVMLAAAWYASRTRALRPIAFGIVWFYLALVPSSSVVPLAEVTNEHRIFFPYIGLAMAAVWAVALLARRTAWPRWATAMLAVVVLASHAAGTYARNRVWSTEETLWSDVVRTSPRNGRAWMNYGLTLMQKGRYAEALGAFETARRFTPNYPYLETNLGIATGALGDAAGAEEHFRRAIALDDGLAETKYFYARWLVDQGRSPEAVPLLERALAISPNTPHTGVLLMKLYAARGDLERLSALAERLTRMSPELGEAAAFARGETPFDVADRSAQGFYLKGWELTQAGEHLDAALAYRKALALDPNHTEAANNLGWTLGKLGFFVEAAPVLETAVRLAPSSELARNNLAWVRSRLPAP